MKKCVRVSFTAPISHDFLVKNVQGAAKKLSLEGIAQIGPAQEVKIIVYGDKNTVDTFLDVLHRDLHKLKILNIAVEPYIKDKDYRGVFRVLHT